MSGTEGEKERGGNPPFSTLDSLPCGSCQVDGSSDERNEKWSTGTKKTNAAMPEKKAAPKLMKLNNGSSDLKWTTLEPEGTMSGTAVVRLVENLLHVAAMKCYT